MKEEQEREHLRRLEELKAKEAEDQRLREIARAAELEAEVFILTI